MIRVEMIVERCAGIDVHQAEATVCVRVPGADGERVEELASFGTTTPDLLALGITRKQLRGFGWLGVGLSGVLSKLSVWLRSMSVRLLSGGG